MDYIFMGRQIRKERQRQQLTQAELAERVDVSTSFIGHVERGSRKASLETVVKISEALGMSIDSMVLPSNIGGALKQFDAKTLSDVRNVLEIMLTLLRG